jgi:hypothetical protein
MGVKRVVGAEQYFTDPDLAERCVRFAQELVNFSEFSLFVEPSAGDGSFFRLLPPECRVGIDIHPRDEMVVEADFLSWTPPRSDKIIIIGNPPFGQRAAIAFDFLEHACALAEVVAFILPRSFMKYTFQNRVNPMFHLLGSLNCEEFYGPSGERHSVKTVFQVWQRGEYERALEVHPDSHPHFEMRHAHLSRVDEEALLTLRQDYKFTLPQVGSNFTPRDSGEVTKGSHWFIRPLAPNVRERFELLDFAFLDGMNTAHKSLSKRDIIRAYQAILDQETYSGSQSAPSQHHQRTHEQRSLWSA